MKVTTLTFKIFCSNTYVIGEEGEPAIIIDPGYSKKDYFFDYIKNHHGGRCLGIILTHTHFDHLEGLVDCSLLENTPVFVHTDDEQGIFDRHFNLSALEGRSVEIENANIVLLDDEDEINLGPYCLKVIHTPFHSHGSICLYIQNENILFSGDTLFNRGVGRTDFKTSCPRFMTESLKKLAKLPPETIVYPGHGRPTTIDTEANYGYLRGLK